MASAVGSYPNVPKNVLDDIAFPFFYAEDRRKRIETMNSLKDILEPTITRAVKNKKRPI
jgi:hypothetical protein